MWEVYVLPGIVADWAWLPVVIMFVLGMYANVMPNKCEITGRDKDQPATPNNVEENPKHVSERIDAYVEFMKENGSRV